MRNAVPWVASIAFLLGIGILGITWALSSHHAEIYQAVATDFSVAMIDLAITIGVVDLLLRAYSERQRIRSIAPRVAELANKLANLQQVKQRYLNSPSAGDLERYRRSVAEVQQSAFDLHVLMSGSNSVLASDLLRLSHEMSEHSEVVEDAIASLRNVSADSKRWIGEVAAGSDRILSSGVELSSTLEREFQKESIVLAP